MDRKTNKSLACFIFIIINLILNSCLAVSSSYDFQLINEKILPNQLGTFKQLRFISADQSTIIAIDAIKLSHQYHAKVYEQKQNNQFSAHYIGQLLRYENFVIAMNGGYYSKRFQPIGLFIKEDNIITPWANSSLLSACVKVDKSGKLSIGFNKKLCINAWSALQSGPLLIENGNIRSRLYVTKNSSDFYEKNYRTVIALSDENEALLLVSSQAKLTDIAYILKNNPKAFDVKHIQTAINLDGGSSTGMYIAFPSLPFYIHELKPVKTFIMIN